MMQGALTRPLF